MKQLPSPNFNDRPDGVQPRVIVLHYTGMPSLDEALTRLCAEESQVSSHYTIARSGEIYQHVADDKRAWHAGISHWQGSDNVNDFSIGIELENLGHEFGYQPFPDAQLKSIIELCSKLKKKYNIHNSCIIGHSDIAPDRKEDPGELFNWKLLADNDLGIWPVKPFPMESGGRPLLRPGMDGDKVLKMKQGLQKIGYKISDGDIFDAKTANLVTAFRRHFVQNLLHPIWDMNCEFILKQLIE